MFEQVSRHVYMVSKRTDSVQQFLSVAISTIGAFLVFLFLNADYFLGNEKLLGPHDTQIPFFSSWQFSNDLNNGNYQIFNYFDQTDYAYSHGTTGHFTIPAFLTAIIAKVINLIFADQMTGKLFLQIHSIVWVVSQLIVRNTGFLLLARLLNIPRIPIFITLIFFQPLFTYTLTLHYLIGFVYSFIPLLLYYIVKTCKFRSKWAALDFLVVFAIAIGQSPVFAIAYMFQSVYILILVLTFLKRRQIIESLKKFLKSESKLSKRFSIFVFKNGFKKVHIDTRLVISLLTIFANSIWAIYSLSSIKRNYAIPVERSLFLDFSTWTTLTFRGGANDLGQLVDVQTNATMGGWQFIGFLGIFLFILGFWFFRRNTWVLSFSLTNFLIYCIQISPLYALSRFWDELIPNLITAPIKIFTLFFKEIYFAIFPFSSIFRSPTMLIWAVYLIAIPIVALGVNVLFGNAANFAETNKSKILELITFITFSVIGLYAFSESPIVMLGLCFVGLAFALSFVKLQVKLRILATYLILFLGILFTMGQLRSNMDTPVLFGGKIEARSFKVSTNDFWSDKSIVEYVTPFKSIDIPVILNSDPPAARPKTGIFTLDNQSSNSSYFGTQTNVSKYWGIIFLGDYVKNDYYQNKHIIFDKFRLENLKSGTVINFTSIVSSDRERKNPNFYGYFSAPVSKPIVQPKTDLKFAAKIESVSIGKYSKNYLVIRDKKLIAFNPTSLMSGTLLDKLICDGRTISLSNPVFGLPMTEGAYSINSFQNAAIFVQAKVKLHGKFNCMVSFRKSEFFGGESNHKVSSSFKGNFLLTTVNLDKKLEQSYLIWAIPYQDGWVGRLNNGKEIELESCNGWLCYKKLSEFQKGTNVKIYITYAPHGTIFSTIFFFQGAINLLLWIIVSMVKKRDKQNFI
jgi:hypothetical protein